MKGCLVSVLNTIRRTFKMTGVNRDAPFGTQCLQRLCNKLCPRWQFNRLRCYQASVLVLTFLTYMTYHLTRKPISVVKSVLHRNCSTLVPPPGVDPANEDWCDWPPFNTDDANTLLGALDSAFLFSYAGAMFVSGMVAERVDLRYFLTLGMLISALFCYMFGVGYTYSVHNMTYYLIAQAGAGVAQTTGWPGTVSVLGKWFGTGKRGLIFGVWNSHTSIGNILGTLLASDYVEGDWSLSFIYPALAMGCVATLVFLFLPPEPKHVGIVLQPTDNCPSRQSRSDDEEEPQVIVGDQAASLRPNRHSANNPPYQASEDATEETALLRRPSHSHAGAVSLTRALAIPGVVEFSLSLFFAKLVSYTFLYWLPLYINTSTSLTPRESGLLSTVFDVGGAAGAILAGLLADRSASPATVCGAFYLLGAPALDPSAPVTVTDEDIRRLNTFRNTPAEHSARIVFTQRTPIRVLHRRPLLVRTRCIYELHAEKVPEHPRLLCIRLVSMAGAYIKELVHGECGRTAPALRESARAPIDLLALDVSAVLAVWPPTTRLH